MSERYPWAFPHEMGEHDGVHGMTLRDYFAAAAIVGVNLRGSNTQDRQEIAERAYAFADAMLIARRDKPTA